MCSPCTHLFLLCPVFPRAPPSLAATGRFSAVQALILEALRAPGCGHPAQPPLWSHTGAASSCLGSYTMMQMTRKPHTFLQILAWLVPRLAPPQRCPSHPSLPRPRNLSPWTSSCLPCVLVCVCLPRLECNLSRAGSSPSCRLLLP